MTQGPQGPSEPPPGAPGPQNAPGPPAGLAGAGLGRRIGARILDVLIVGIPISILLAFIGFGAGAFDMRNTGQQWISSLVYSLLWFGYFVALESSRGATLGKQLAGIRVIDAGGGLPSTEVAAKRNAWMLLGLIPVIGGLLSFVAVIAIIITITRGSDAHGIHDEWAGSAVVQA